MGGRGNLHIKAVPQPAVLRSHVGTELAADSDRCQKHACEVLFYAELLRLRVRTATTCATGVRRQRSAHQTQLQLPTLSDIPGAPEK